MYKLLTNENKFALYERIPYTKNGKKMEAGWIGRLGL